MTTKKTTTKKVVVKKTVQKPITKKTTKKTISKKLDSGKKLVIATGANCFWVYNGPILRDLVELEKALHEMNEKIFTHHVSGKRNDFADWIEMVLKDGEAAIDFRKAKKPKTARAVIVKQLKLYKLPSQK